MNRKRKRNMQKRFKLTDEQLNKLQSEANMEYVETEVKKRLEVFQGVFNKCLLEAFDRNGISKIKAKSVIDDVELLVKREVIKDGKKA